MYIFIYKNVIKHKNVHVCYIFIYKNVHVFYYFVFIVFSLEKTEEKTKDNFIKDNFKLCLKG